MEVNIYKKIDSRDYHTSLMEQNIRADGRRLEQYRDLTVLPNILKTSEGSSMVKIGRTSVISSVKAEVSVPRDDQPEEGYVVINVDIPNLCTTFTDIHQAKRRSEELTTMLNDRLFPEGDEKGCLFPLSKLCISRENAVWVLYVDCVCKENDGNLEDACLISCISALKHAKIPAVEFDEEEMSVFYSEKSNPWELPMDVYPLSCSFSLFTDICIVVDPSYSEEIICDSRLVVFIDSNGGFIGIDKKGGNGMAKTDVLECCKRARGYALASKEKLCCV